MHCFGSAVLCRFFAWQWHVPQRQWRGMACSAPRHAQSLCIGMPCWWPALLLNVLIMVCHAEQRMVWPRMGSIGVGAWGMAFPPSHPPQSTPRAYSFFPSFFRGVAWLSFTALATHAVSMPLMWQGMAELSQCYATWRCLGSCVVLATLSLCWVCAIYWTEVMRTDRKMDITGRQGMAWHGMGSSFLPGNGMWHSSSCGMAWLPRHATAAV